MYIPAHFAESDLPTLHDFIERHSFGVMVSQVEGYPFATHLPFLLEQESGPFGSLVGHTARVNPQCKATGDQTVIAIFSGPHAYISPSWYEAENVVPTWNYSAVHVTGRLQIIDDSQALADLVTRMTDRYERSMPNPWSFDGSTTFAERLLSQIIGFRIVIERMEGKRKMSQNQPAARQQKVVAALRQRSDPDSQAVADIMEGN